VYAGLVSIRPGDGAVVALYGGADYQARQFSAATDAVIQGGSNFKPFTLIAALQQGISTKTLIDGGSPLKDPALGNFTVRNAGGRSYGQIDLRKATASSVNTAFVRLNLKIGPASTKAAAIAAGIPESTLGLGIDPTNTCWARPRRTCIDMANGYATIAAQGRRATPYLIKQVTSNAIDVTYTGRAQRC
jgi:membrane carboxypeptidase/penicillin-binding protein